MVVCPSAALFLFAVCGIVQNFLCICTLLVAEGQWATVLKTTDHLTLYLSIYQWGTTVGDQLPTHAHLGTGARTFPKLSCCAVRASSWVSAWQRDTRRRLWGAELEPPPPLAAATRSAPPTAHSCCFYCNHMIGSRSVGPLCRIPTHRTQAEDPGRMSLADGRSVAAGAVRGVPSPKVSNRSKLPRKKRTFSKCGETRTAEGQFGSSHTKRWANFRRAEIWVSSGQRVEAGGVPWGPRIAFRDVQLFSLSFFSPLSSVTVLWNQKPWSERQRWRRDPSPTRTISCSWWTTERWWAPCPTSAASLRIWSVCWTKVNQLLFERFHANLSHWNTTDETGSHWLGVCDHSSDLLTLLNSHEVQEFLTGSRETRESHYPHAALKDATDKSLNALCFRGLPLNSSRVLGL